MEVNYQILLLEIQILLLTFIVVKIYKYLNDGQPKS